LSDQQKAEVQARVALANTIVQNVAADAKAKGASASWRVDLLSSLYSTPSAVLQKVAATANTLDQAHALAPAKVHTTVVTADSIGDAGDSLVFVPMSTCRFIDTRNVGGAITSSRNFNLVYTGSTYGGSGSCYVPGDGEPAFAANVTVVVPAGPPGYLGLRPYGTTNTTSFINWTAAGAPDGLANAGVISTAVDGSSDYEFNAFVLPGTSPQMIMDFFGYFEQASTTAQSFDCVATSTNTNTLAAGAQNYFYAPACSAGYTAVMPYCYTTDGSTELTGSGVSNNAVGQDAFCAWHNYGGVTSGNLLSGAQCCRTAAIP
jgi:hypothetical protein